MNVKCGHCGNEQPYNGKNTYVNCRKCDYKIFFAKPRLEDVKVAEGLTRLEVKLETTSDRIRLIPWGDVHIGAPKDQCDWDKAQSELDYILETPDTYLVGMGDYMDCAQKMPWSRGPSVYVSSLTPMEQFTVIEQALKPLAEKGKILGLHGGNHENWIMENTGIQIIDLLCRSLKVPFLADGCTLTITVNKYRYMVYSKHTPGTVNARTASGALTGLIRPTNNIYADLYLAGHAHQLMVYKLGKVFNGRMFKSYAVFTGHFLNWLGSYAEIFCYNPVPSGCPQIKLFSERHDVHVSI